MSDEDPDRQPNGPAATTRRPTTPDARSEETGSTARERTSATKLVSRLALLVGGLAGAILLIEVGLRVVGAFAPFGRARPPESGDHFVVLCVGDSHTWGSGEGYPAQLAARMRSRVPDARVVNLGVPGTNTAQLAARLPDWLDRYRANIVIVWSGANNMWNRSETDHWKGAGVEPPGLGRRLLDRSKLLRLLRLTRDEQRRPLEVEALNERSRATEALRAADDVYVKPTEVPVPEDDPKRQRIERKLGDEKTWIRRRELGALDEFLNVAGEKLGYEEVERVTELDVRSMAGMAEERGIPMLVITYPQDLPWWQAPSRGISAAAGATGLILVSGPEALEEARKKRTGDQPLFDKSFHPAAPLYEEIGNRVFEALETEGLLPESATLRVTRGRKLP